jgi:hypothetical protein
MLLLEVCCVKHVLGLLVPGHVCGFTILQHPVLQWPLLCILLYHVWVPLGKQWYWYMYVMVGIVYLDLTFMLHCWQSNCVKISSVSLERTKETCLCFDVDPLVDPKKCESNCGLWVVLRSSRIASRVSQHYFTIPPAIILLLWILIFTSSPPLLLCWVWWGDTLVCDWTFVCVCVCVCLWEGGGGEREASNSVACFCIMLILAHTDSNNRHMPEVTRHPSCQSA